MLPKWSLKTSQAPTVPSSRRRAELQDLAGAVRPGPTVRGTSGCSEDRAMLPQGSISPFLTMFGNGFQALLTWPALFMANGYGKADQKRGTRQVSMGPKALPPPRISREDVGPQPAKRTRPAMFGYSEAKE